MTERGVCRWLTVVVLAAVSGLGLRTRQVDRDMAHVASRHAETGQTVADAHAVAAVAVETCQAAKDVAADARLLIDAVSGADHAAVARDTALLCGLLYLADATGKRRELTSQPDMFGLKGAPAAGEPWAAFDGQTPCDVCDAGYQCNTPGPRGGGKR